MTAPFPILDRPRLEGFATGRDPVVFARTARGVIATFPERGEALRSAAPQDLPDLLHQLRSLAVAVGMARLADTVARVEQRAERGFPPSSADIDAVLDLADRSARELTRWWATTLPPSPASHG